MTIKGLKPRTTRAVKALTAMINERQHLVGRVEALTEANKRVALIFDRERAEIMAALPKAGFLQRGRLKRQAIDLDRRYQHAVADFAADQVVIDGLLKEIEALDARLEAVNRHYSPKQANPKTPAAEVRH
jgi:hypothetical protein